ncbi:MAG: 30S ribosomal protein S8 [Candidatus Paceibacterota bacterium]|jgi:small subunit ribosomal protein S8
MVTDTIGDLIIRLKNANDARKESIVISHSNLKESVANLLVKEGYVKSVAKRKKGIEKSLEIGLLYTNGTPRIREVKRMSKPSRRMYVQSSDLRPFKRGFGLVAISTSKGLMSDKDARTAKIGGEVLFKIW